MGFYYDVLFYPNKDNLDRATAIDVDWVLLTRKYQYKHKQKTINFCNKGGFTESCSRNWGKKNHRKLCVD